MKKYILNFFIISFTQNIFATFNSINPTILVFTREIQKQKNILLLNNSSSTPINLFSKNKLHHYDGAMTVNGLDLAYISSTNDFEGSLKTINLKTKAIEQWTSPEKPANHLQPAFSSDGNFLIFSTPVGENKINQVAIIDVKKTRIQNNSSVTVDEDGAIQIYNNVEYQVISSEFPSFHPHLSSDNSFIIFQRNRSKEIKDIVLYNRLDQKVEILSKDNSENVTPALSKDDRYIAYANKTNGQFDISIYDRLTKLTTEINRPESDELFPVFNENNDLVFSKKISDEQSLLYKISFVSWNTGIKDERTLLAENIISKDFNANYSGSTELSQTVSQTQLETDHRVNFEALTDTENIYLVGGQKVDEVLSDILVINKSTNQKTNILLPLPLINFTAHLFNNEIIIIGGKTNTHEVNGKIYSYNFQSQKWSTLNNLMTPRFNHQAIFSNNFIYILGGENTSNLLSSIEIYDLNSNTINPIETQMPIKLTKFSAVSLGQKVFFAGGKKSDLTLSDKSYLLDLQTMKFKEVTNLPMPMSDFNLISIGNHIMSIGGLTRFEERIIPTGHIFIFNLNDMKWSHSGRYLEHSYGKPYSFKIGEDLVWTFDQFGNNETLRILNQNQM